MLAKDSVCVLTARGLHKILKEGGSKSWVLDSARAMKMKYVICVQNRNFPDDWGEATAEHHTAFLVGKLKEVVPADNDGRWLLRFSEYAEVDSDEKVWPGNRNPVMYTSLEEMGIKVEDLEFKPMPPPNTAERRPDPPFTIAECKRRLAAAFDVSEDKITITISA